MNKKLNIENLVRENIKNLKPYSSARDEFKDVDRDMVFLDANENPFQNGVNRYPDPHQRNLKEVLAVQKGVSTSQILLGNGSDEVLDLLFRAFCEPNRDNIITLPPTYGMYRVLANTNAIANNEVLLTSGFQPQVDKILDTVDTHTKLIFICSPNNPTGNNFSSESIQKILNGFNGLVVVDEAYIDFSKAASWVKRLDEFPNLVITQTLSKAYGMAGIRLGICYASKEIIAILKKIKPPYNVNELTQQRALEGYENIALVRQQVGQLLKERDFLERELQMVPFVQEIFPSDANFILARVDDAYLRYQQLLEKGIVVRDRSTQPLCENTLRFTIGTKKENETLIKALKELNR